MKLFKYITGFIILFTIQFVCTKIINYTHLNLPSPILGIIVLAILLEFKIINKELIKDTCNLLMSNMTLLFIPLFVGITAYSGIIKNNLVPIFLNIIVTSIITLIVSAIFVENIIKFIRFQKLRSRKNG